MVLQECHYEEISVVVSLRFKVAFIRCWLDTVYDVRILDTIQQVGTH